MNTKYQRENVMKKIALILALVLMLTPILVSCNKTTDVDVKETNKTVEDTTEYKYSLDDLPELDFGKQNFSSFGTSGASGSVVREAETGDLMNDAVFQRMITIEDRYNLKFNMVDSKDHENSSEVRKLILADDKTYHTFYSKLSIGMQNMVMRDYFVDWNELEHVDYDKPYWNTNIAYTMNFGGKVYFMAGDYGIGTYNATDCIMFNKNLFDDLGIDYPYQDVYDKTWTIDKFIEITKQGYADLDGDTMWDKDKDRTGFGGWSWEMFPAVYFGMGGTTLVPDEDMLPTLALSTERNVKIIDKMLELFDGQNSWYYGADYGSHMRAMSEGRILMVDLMLNSIPVSRDYEFDTGVLPYPMLDEDQDKYYSRSGPDYAAALYVPTTNSQLEETGIILEALSIEGYNKIRPVYYDITLDLKSASDEETRDMIDIILESSLYQNENYVGSSTLVGLVSSGTNTFASWCASREQALEREVKKMRDFYAK